MAELRKLSEEGGSYRTTLPKDDLQEMGVLDENGDLEKSVWVKIESSGESWTLNVVEV